jgi:hypothetical protein
MLAVGSYDRHLIHTFKRVNAYTFHDYETLERFARGFRDVITTPHILTEVSNLANSLPYYAKQGWFDHFSQRIKDMEERQIPARELVKMSEFSAFGLTDAALSLLATNVLLATADERLCTHLQRNGLLAISFNEIRAADFPGL